MSLISFLNVFSPVKGGLARTITKISILLHCIKSRVGISPVNNNCLNLSDAAGLTGFGGGGLLLQLHALGVTLDHGCGPVSKATEEEDGDKDCENAHPESEKDAADGLHGVEIFL